VQAAVLTVHTTGPDETREVGARVASLLRPGDAVSLTGELGAGKTCFVQGAAGALGVTRRVTSPTFMLLRHYPEATPPVVHCDVYRLDHLQDVLDLGDEVLASDVVTFIEWGDAVAALLPGDRLEVELRIGADGDAAHRTLRLVGHGAFADRIPALAEACAAWTDGSR
jgi:tRNA threonylcarbamoyladenosine biosynthesis protein TsaE